jgi:site-specific recombinase XerD
MVVRVDVAAEELVQAFATHQSQERGLAERTVYNATFIVRGFLAWRAEAGCAGIGELRPEEIGDFVVHEAARLKPTGMVNLTSMLRGFVRFLFLTGVTAADLSGAVPSVRTSRFGALPSAVDQATTTALLDSCERTRPTGRRDYAILVLMSRLGLRAAEIAPMRLEDLDWRAGELEVRDKGGRHARLPLPADVGEALVDYLCNGRPDSTSREVFLRALPPPVGMSRNAVVFVSREASGRAGIAVVGGHRLRHTTATELLGHGASLYEVGQVLRQDHSTTTAIYAKVDVARLSSVARPWPTSAAR